MNIEHTTSYYLLLPMLGIEYQDHLHCGIDEVYLGCPEYTGNEELGEYMFITYKNWKSAKDDVRERISSISKDSFTNETNGLYTKVFDIPEEYKIDIEYFKRGDYSKINKEYVEKYFPKYIEEDGIQIKYPNRMIFDKDPDLRDAWDLEYNVQIPEDTEVWPKPGSRELLATKSDQYNGNSRTMPMVPIGSK